MILQGEPQIDLDFNVERHSLVQERDQSDSLDHSDSIGFRLRLDALCPGHPLRAVRAGPLSAPHHTARRRLASYVRQVLVDLQPPLVPAR